MLHPLYSLTHTQIRRLHGIVGLPLCNGCTFASLRPGHLGHIINRPRQPVTFLSPPRVQLHPQASLSAAPHKAQVPQDPSFAGCYLASSSIIAQEGLAGQNQAGAREDHRASAPNPSLITMADVLVISWCCHQQ